ncbi:MAG: hypothetical protein ACR2OT_04050 [Parvibaculales bacterium]
MSESEVEGCPVGYISYAHQYEVLLRKAFGRVLNESGEMLERYSDPAGLANTDWFSERTIHKAKTGLAYAASIIATLPAFEALDKDFELSNEINNLIRDVLAAESIKELIKPLGRLDEIEQQLS